MLIGIINSHKLKKQRARRERGRERESKRGKTEILKREYKIIPVPVQSPMMVKQKYSKLLLFCILGQSMMYQKVHKHQFLPHFLINKSESRIR